MDCPDENVLAGYVDGGIRAERRASVARHLDDCPVCRAIVSDLSGRPTATTMEYRTSRIIHLVPGTMVGEYEVTGQIGAGGMGAVFAAIHPRIGKKAAIKVLQRELADDPSSIVRFENEARAVNSIGHANIVDIFAFGELPDGNPYFVMEHIVGESLDRWLLRRPRLSLEQAMPILRQIFDALAAAHARGIIHRDLKPGNIMVAGGDAGPRIKVLDFGLAKIVRNRDSLHHLDDAELTMPGVVMGTPLFMSPEQYLGENVDHRTDIYALGVIIFQMLCGEYPFVGNTPSAIGGKHVSEPPRPPSSVMPKLSAMLDRVVIKALAKDPAQRFATVAELRAALEDCVWARETEDETTLPPDKPSQRAAHERSDIATIGSAITEAALPGTPPPETVQPAAAIAAATTAQVRRRWSRLVLLIAFLSTLALGAIVLLAASGHRNVPVQEGADSNYPHVEVETDPSVQRTQPPVETGSAAGVSEADQATPPPPIPVPVKQPKSTVLHKGTATTKNKGSGATTAGSAKTPCNPYRSLDGC